MYVAVLGAAMLITVLGLSALLAARVEGRSAVTESDIADARRAAAAALDLGRYTVTRTSTWRSRTSGQWFTGVPLGSATMSLSVVDPDDGNLANQPDGRVVITGTGRKGDATQIFTVTMEPQTRGWSCLDVGIFAGGAVTLTSATVNADRTLSSNTSVTATTSSVKTNVEAVGAIAGGTFEMATTTGARPRTSPDSTVWSWYTANGTNVSIGSVPEASGRKVIQKCILSPASNPLGGGLNSRGIYVIDCSGSAITVQDCRILGTLVLLNPGAGSLITGSVRWDPAQAGMPCLLVKGDLVIATSQTALSESALATNFNPSGTPYNGSSDTDTADTYPSSIGGLLYISGNAVLQGHNAVQGAIAVGGTLGMTLNATTGVAARLDLAYDGTYYTTPPPGFAAPTAMIVTPGSLVQVVK
jgi:hypothetical protein